MKLMQWKDQVINLDGLREARHFSTNAEMRLFFQGEPCYIVCSVLNDKEKAEFINRLFQVVAKYEKSN